MSFPPEWMQFLIALPENVADDDAAESRELLQ
jgi:hypothetical protein